MAKHINLDLLHHKLKALQLTMLKITESTTINDLLMEKLVLSDELGKIIDKYLPMNRDQTKEEQEVIAKESKL